MHAQGLKSLAHSYVCTCIRAKAGASIHLRGRPCRQMHKKITLLAHENTCRYTCARCCKYENRKRHTTRHGSYVKCTNQRRRNRRFSCLLITYFHYLYFWCDMSERQPKKEMLKNFCALLRAIGKSVHSRPRASFSFSLDEFSFVFAAI